MCIYWKVWIQSAPVVFKSQSPFLLKSIKIFLFDQFSSILDFPQKMLMHFVGSRERDFWDIAIVRGVSGRWSLPGHPTHQELLLKEHQILWLGFSGEAVRAPFPVHIKLVKTCSTDDFHFFIFPLFIDSLSMFYRPKPSSISQVMTFLDFTGSSL